MSKESESYRLEMLRRLKHEYGETPPPEVLKAQHVIADYRQRKAAADPVIARASAPLPEPDLCPSCWIDHERRSKLIAIPHKDPARFDAWECPVCEYFEEHRFKD